mmetsp:Transcript_4744/g.7205  ORF Transcript_4744/g.7205 Transcript_4744/m.7205 type:complete len:451 (+) Transcript_4744:60-1412(+)
MYLYLVFFTYCLIAASIVFVMFCADTDSKGVLGDVSRVLINKLPNMIRVSLKALCGERCLSFVDGSYDYIVNKPNPLLQILYLSIINVAYIFWLLHGQPLIPTYLVANYHVYIVFCGIVVCQGFFFWACYANPGVITAETEALHDCLPYDGTVYVDGLHCRTCETKKVPRSKHCSLCNCCIARFDHHCVWLNQCVGEGNYRHFLAFLAVHVVFLWYASYISGAVMISKAFEKDLFNATFVNRRTGKISKATTGIILKYILFSNYTVTIVFALVSVMGAALTGFLGYHLYLISQGTTTNETFKWKEAHSIYKRLVELREMYEKSLTSSPSSTMDSSRDKSSDPSDDTAEETSSSSENVEVMYMTPTGMALRGLLRLDTNDVPDPGEPPVNIYNKGFLTNLSDVIWPLSSRPENIDRCTRTVSDNQPLTEGVGKNERTSSQAGKKKSKQKKR